MPELETLSQSTAVPIEIRGGLASKEGKTNVLLQAWNTSPSTTGYLLKCCIFVSTSVHTCRGSMLHTRSH